MFKNQGLFNSILCPNYPKCSSQSHCIYNHIPPTIINKKKQSNPVMERVIKRSLPENTVVRPALKVRKVEGSNEGNAVASSSKLPITKVSKPIKSIPVVSLPSSSSAPKD